MKNTDLFEYCKKNKEKFLDQFYIFPEKQNDLERYEEKTKKIKNTLIAIKEISNKPNSISVIDDLFSELIKYLKKYAN